ncbi:MAG: P-loop NTPase [Oscillospiraceae bacterium]|nr:P-loop NTPase [Oscillospiraceae bacterium]
MDTPKERVAKNLILLTVSGKGGTGKTAAGAGIASCMAALGHETVLMDADIGLRNADIVLGVTDKAVIDFGDVTDGSAALDDALIAHPDVGGLYVLPAPAREKSIERGALADMLSRLKQRFRFVWIDGPAGNGEWVRTLAGLADMVLFVATPDVASIRDAARMADMLDVTGGRLIVNRVRPHMIKRSGAMFIDDIMDETGLPLLGLIPEDERVMVAGNKGRALILYGQDGAVTAYRDIALRLLGRSVPLCGMKVTVKAKKDFMRRINGNSGA